MSASFPGEAESAQEASAAADAALTELGAAGSDEAGYADAPDFVVPEDLAVPADLAGAASYSEDWDADADDSGDQVITETLAEIYAGQGLYERAAAVYRRLVEARPGDERLAARLRELDLASGWGRAQEPESETVRAEEDRANEAWLERVESAWTGAEGVAGAEDSPYTWQMEPREDAGGARVGDYFRSLLAWRPAGAAAAPEATLAESSALPGTTAGTVAAQESEAAFQEWTGQHPAEGETPARPGTESDEDLEMFRSWLKSLKK